MRDKPVADELLMTVRVLGRVEVGEATEGTLTLGQISLAGVKAPPPLLGVCSLVALSLAEEERDRGLSSTGESSLPLVRLLELLLPSMLLQKHTN